MFFIIPVGSEEGVRRLPFVTIGLIIVNCIIWVISALIISTQTKALERKQEEILEFLAPHQFTIIENAPELFYVRDPETVFQKIENLNLFPAESEETRRWHQLIAEWQEMNNRFLYRQFGFTPRYFNLFNLITYMFLHAGFFHLLFNMLYLWMVGCNIEDDWSWKIFLGLYLISGAAAGLMHAGVFPHSATPLIGASGAIAGIMGAFMIRHFKTRIRFAYFVWLFITRPFYGTFPLYAGIALPIWFLGQFISIKLYAGLESGTAYWAHVGGFMFGAAVGTAFKFLGIEKKYIAPMVEDSFERLKMSPKMKEADRLLESGDRVRARELLRQVIREEPDNTDAGQILARLCLEMDQRNEAADWYNLTMERLLQRSDITAAASVFEEINENNLTEAVSEKNLYHLGQAQEKAGRIPEAAFAYENYNRLFPAGRVRAKVLCRLLRLYQHELKDENKSRLILETLQKAFPDYPVSSP